MQNLTQPTLLLKPFAENGDKNAIPATNTDPSKPQLADLNVGFPPITSEDPDNGGLPPERADFNGLGYLTTTYDFFAQAGGTYTYNATVAAAIGGYPNGARLWYKDGNGVAVILRSTKDDNTDDFTLDPSYIGTSWVAETPALPWNNTWTGNNTFSGGLTASGSVSLGSSATASTKGYTDNSTSLATTAFVKTVLDKIWPTGSVYIGTQSTCPLATLIPGSSWSLVGTGKALWCGNGSTGNGSQQSATVQSTGATNTIKPGLPNITGKHAGHEDLGTRYSGCFTDGGDQNTDAATGGSQDLHYVNFDASRSNSIYGASSTVQPPAYVVNVWRRTA